MKFIQTINPCTETISANYHFMNHDEINCIVNKTKHAQNHWKKTSMEIRKNCMKNIANLLLKNSREYAELITISMGKPIAQSILEIEKCYTLCQYYIENSETFLAPQIIKTEFYKSYKSYEPLGIIFAIMPWNFPFWQIFRFAVPNLMSGNACILKHAPNTTQISLVIEQMFIEAGFPSNIFSSVIIDLDLIPNIIQHKDIAGVSLTGSTQAGKSVASIAGHALKKVVLELGGNDPYIILEDADLELAATECVRSRLNNAGQVCVAAKRIIVIETILDKFINLVIEQVKQYSIGDPMQKSTKLGPLARADIREKIHLQVQKSIKKGAKCILGGEIPKATGYYYPATILTNITPDSPAFTEELFGPVICIIAAKDEYEAIKIANMSEFGLGGAIFTKNIKKGEQIAKQQINAGICAVNTFIASDPRLPFGGIKQSGYGRELSIEGLHEFVNIKTIIVRD